MSFSVGLFWEIGHKWDIITCVILHERMRDASVYCHITTQKDLLIWHILYKVYLFIYFFNFFPSFLFSLYFRDCENCTCLVACEQFRARGCRDMHVSLYSASQPVIEASSDFRFACYQLFYPQLRGGCGVGWVRGGVGASIVAYLTIVSGGRGWKHV